VTRNYQTIVIGGGQAGLVTGYYLAQHDVDFAILDANEEAGGSWQHYYESLKLFSPAKYGQLPGLKFPGNPAHYPTRYEVIDYLKQYEQTHDIPVKRGVRVANISQDNGRFRLETASGETYMAQTVIAASGPHNTPHIPEIPGANRFAGQSLHSFAYDVPQLYEGQHVVVVGARDSAMQIAYDLAPYARVSMATRHSLKFMPKYVLGKSVFWWLHDTGYDQLPLGLFTRLKGSMRIVGKEPYSTALKSGNPAVKPMFTKITETGVVWGNGSHEDVDTIIYATGFKPGLGYLKTLGALEADGYPAQYNGASTAVEGLYYVGMFGQRSHASATLRGVGRDAHVVARKVADYLNKKSPTTILAAGD
jgi:putative flavoprotein involved in K+ transport